MSDRSISQERTERLRRQGLDLGRVHHEIVRAPRAEWRPESCSGCALHCIDFCQLTVYGPPQKVIERYIEAGKLSISPHWEDYLITARHKHPVYGTAFTVIFTGKKSGMPAPQYMRHAIGTSVNSGGH